MREHAQVHVLLVVMCVNSAVMAKRARLKHWYVSRYVEQETIMCLYHDMKVW